MSTGLYRRRINFCLTNLIIIKVMIIWEVTEIKKSFNLLKLRFRMIPDYLSEP